MNRDAADRLKELRQRVPVGLRTAVALLDRANGDVDRAEIWFREESVAQVIQATGVATNVASEHLLRSFYDVDAAIESIEVSRLTLGELILRRHKEPELALEVLSRATLLHHGLGDQVWLDWSATPQLSPQVQAFLVTMEWLCFEACEGFDDALGFNVELLLEELQNRLGLQKLADTLRLGYQVRQGYFAELDSETGVDKLVAVSNAFCRDQDFLVCQSEFVREREGLISRLYQYVQEHIAEFP